MKRIALVLGVIAAAMLLAGCAGNCGVQTSCYGASSGCGQPVYPGQSCLEFHPKVTGFFGNIHEKIFNCEPDPVYMAAPCPPAAPRPCSCPGR